MKSPQYSLIGTKSEDKAQTMANHETPFSILAVADENRIEDYICDHDENHATSYEYRRNEDKFCASIITNQTAPFSDIYTAEADSNPARNFLYMVE